MDDKHETTKPQLSQATSTNLRRFHKHVKYIFIDKTAKSFPTERRKF